MPRGLRAGIGVAAMGVAVALVVFVNEGPVLVTVGTGRGFHVADLVAIPLVLAGVFVLRRALRR